MQSAHCALRWLLFVRNHAQYLEELKVTNPAEYKAVMQDLQEAANEAKKGFEPVLPGGGKKLGADGINGTKEEVCWQRDSVHALVHACLPLVLTPTRSALRSHPNPAL